MSIPVISVEQMRQWEKATWSTGQTENAVIARVGKIIARRALELTQANDSILILAGKARALLKGRYHVSTEDIRQVALPVLRHRIVTNFNAEAEGMKSDSIVKKLMEFIPRQQYDEMDKTAAKMLRDQPAA